MERGVDEGEGGEEGAGQVRAGEDKRQTPSTLGPYTRQTAYFRSHTAIIETSAVHLMICRCCRSPPIQKCYYHSCRCTTTHQGRSSRRCTLLMQSVITTTSHGRPSCRCTLLMVIITTHQARSSRRCTLQTMDCYYHDPLRTVLGSLYVTDAVNYYHVSSRTILGSLYITDALRYYHDPSRTVLASLYVTDGYYHDPSRTVCIQKEPQYRDSST